MCWSQCHSSTFLTNCCLLRKRKENNGAVCSLFLNDQPQSKKKTMWTSAAASCTRCLSPPQVCSARYYWIFLCYPSKQNNTSQDLVRQLPNNFARHSIHLHTMTIFVATTLHSRQIIQFHQNLINTVVLLNLQLNKLTYVISKLKRSEEARTGFII